MTTQPVTETPMGFTHQTVDLTNWENAYVVGDVHGCLEVLETLLETLDVTDDDLLIFVGDLVRKGPASKAVLDRVRISQNMVSVRGNNEQKFLRGDVSLAELREDDYRYMASLPAALSWDDGLVVHGGVHPERPLAEHTSEQLLTMRSPAGNGYDGPFWFDEYDGPHRVFFGHTVLAEPLEREWAVGLDTGCVYGGALTAYDLRRETCISVPGIEHESRRPEKFLEIDN